MRDPASKSNVETKGVMVDTFNLAGFVSSERKEAQLRKCHHESQLKEFSQLVISGGGSIPLWVVPSLGWWAWVL